MDVIVAETDRAIAEGQKALKRAKKNLESVDRKILKVKITDEQLAIAYERAIGDIQEKCEVKFEPEQVDLNSLRILLNQCRSYAIDGMGLDYESWKCSDILSASIKYDGSSIAGASLLAKSELMQASISTKFLKVIDQAIDQVQLEEIAREALLILDGGRTKFEQSELFGEESDRD